MKKTLLAFLLLLSGFSMAQQRTGSVSKTEKQIQSGCLNLTPADNNLNINSIIENIIGPGIAFSNVRFQGKTGNIQNASIGLFSGGDCVPLGFNEGIILSSGTIGNVMGPNQYHNITAELNLPGDEDLDKLIPGYQTFDATWLEFDFVPYYDNIYIQYVFGSEEYNEYVGSKYNDVFGFFLNGENIALLSGTNTPVAINNVNNGYSTAGTFANGPCVNCQYYRDNANIGNAPYNIESDGMTVALSAEASVNPGVRNTIKLAIADVGDRRYDSWVFIKAESLHHNLGVNFRAEKVDAEVGEPIQFEDLSTEIKNPVRWFWDFGDGSTGANRNLQNPEHIYTRPGKYTVRLTITDELGDTPQEVKVDYITIHPKQDTGIQLQIIKTDPDGEPFINKVGYHYTNNFGQKRLNTFPVINGYAHIDQFPSLNIFSSFNNELILFDSSDRQIGHIFYEYNPGPEKDFTRNAYLILHNDSKISGPGKAFPYGPDRPEYDQEWNYYSTGEYPVSMLIPPNNSFKQNYDDGSIPLLLVHGWEGKFRLISHPNASARRNETSYWFSTAYKLNEEGSPFDAWQYYYPYNSAHKHLAICMKSALQHLRVFYPDQRIRLVTHSMGGLVALQYLVQFPDHASTHVERILFSAPPAHGSLGANLYYKTPKSNLLEFLMGYDRNAPAVRDMKLGSDATWNIALGNLPILSHGPERDYFVLIGTTYKWYASDKKFRAYITPFINPLLVPHSSLHPEASNHHDGIVAISSASLLDKGVGFATFYGNHNDAVHMQSFMRNFSALQNIGDENMMPDIIKAYFTDNFNSFVGFLRNHPHITAVVDGNRQVQKPAGGLTLETLDTGDGVNYQKGVINLEIPHVSEVIEFDLLYKPDLNLALATNNSKAFPGWTKKGVFRRVENDGMITNRYYFNDSFLVTKDDSKALTYNGCAVNLNQGEHRIALHEESVGLIAEGAFNFRYAETVHVKLATPLLAKQYSETNNYTDTKYSTFVVSNDPHNDNKIPFNIDDRATLVEFHISSLDAFAYGFEMDLKLETPDGIILHSGSEEIEYSYTPGLTSVKAVLPDPMPGLWKLWMESDTETAGSMTYSAVAHLASEIHLFFKEADQVIPLEEEVSMVAGLGVPDVMLTEDLDAKAIISRPDGNTETLSITDSEIEGGIIFLNLPYIFDTEGVYSVKYIVNGTYNGFAFERCLHRQIEAVNTQPLFMVPDVSLTQHQPYQELKLSDYLLNKPLASGDQISVEILSTNLAEGIFTHSYNDINTVLSLFTNLTDTGTVKLGYYVQSNGQTLSESSIVNVLLPELEVSNARIAEGRLGNNNPFVLEYTLANTGNHAPTFYEVKYFISDSPTLSPSSVALGTKVIHNHKAETELMISDTVIFPSVGLIGSHYLLIIIDPYDELQEISKTGNMATLEVSLNDPPLSPTIISANPGDQAVRLRYASNHQGEITGYVIYHGKDPEGEMEKTFTYSSDTIHTISGLTNKITYYFAVSSYQILGVDSERSELVSAVPTDEPVIPVGLSAQNITANAALLTWIPEGMEENWDIVYGESPVNPNSDGTNVQNLSENVLQLTDLKSSTEYQAFARSRIGNSVSEWSESSIFTTNHIITASAEKGGSIHPSGSIEVPHLDSLFLTVETEPGYQLKGLLIDGENVGQAIEYLFEKVQQSHTIHAAFELEPHDVTFHVNLSYVTHHYFGHDFDPDSDKVFLTGSMVNWAKPGEMPCCPPLVASEPDTMLYSITMQMPVGTYEYKYFLNEDGQIPEWEGLPNREIIVEGAMEVYDWFGSLNDPTGMAKFLQSAQIMAYPNPARYSIHVESSQAIQQVELINLIGQSVLKEQVSGLTHKIQLTGVQNGTYFLRILTNEEVKVVKIQVHNSN